MASPPSPPPQSSEQSSLSSLNPSILIILLILSITAVVSVSLCLLLRHFRRRRQNQHPQSRRVSPEIGAAAAAETGSFSAAVADSLPVFTSSSVKHRQSSTASGDCSVCLSRFEASDELRLLPLCCHAFHAECIDAWLRANQTCPLCRSPIHASESDINALLRSSGSFRLQPNPDDPPPQNQLRSYSIGSFDYLVENESEVIASQTHHRSVSGKDTAAGADPIPAPALLEDVGGRGWLKDYADRLSASSSSRSLSGRFFAGSSRRTESQAEWDLEARRIGEEITEMFRWFSGV